MPATPTARPATGHVGISVTDLDRSAAFYSRVLDLDVLARSDAEGRRHAFLGADGALVLTLWEQATGTADTARAGLHHLAFQVEGPDAVRAVEARVRDASGTFVHEGLVAHGEGAGSGGIFFLDPDGSRLEVFTPTGLEGAPAPAGDAPTCGFF